MTTATKTYNQARGAIMCRWFGHRSRSTFDPITVRPISYCVRCGQVAKR